jgi:hypothetical protein
MAFRSFIGSCATLTTSVANLSVLMVLKGEPGWICLMCCNADILFCVLVLHWVTSHDRPTTLPSTHATVDGKRCSRALGTDSASAKEQAGGGQVRVKTECVGESLDGGYSRPGRVVRKKEGVCEGAEGGDEVELSKIHGWDCQTREVEGGRMSGGGGASISEDGHWAEDKISVERMV